MSLRRPILAFSLALVLGEATLAQTTDRVPGRSERLEATADGLLSEVTKEAPGVAVLVLREGKPVLRKGYGLADVAEERPIALPTTSFSASATDNPDEPNTCYRNLSGEGAGISKACDQ